MIDKILVLTSEHQPYRRAGLLATLTVADAPIEKLEFLWTCHANDYSDAALLEKLRERGFDIQWNPSVKTKEMSCILSQLLMERIALKKIVDEQVNTLFMHDDFHFNITYPQFISCLEQLSSVVDGVDIVAFINRKRDSLRDKKKFGETPPVIRPVSGTEMFVHGCPYDNGGVWFISPSGAQRLLDVMTRAGDCSQCIDDILSFVLYDDKRIYALQDTEKDNYFVNVKEFEFESIGYYVHSLEHQERMASPMERYRLHV